MSIYQEFTKPTYLYIKQHSKTGLKYFGRYTRSRVKDSVEMYRGSGTYWKNHIKLHGKQHVETLWYCAFLNQEEMTQFALMCSELWNIVESDEWANLMPEDGINGSPSDRIVSEETKLRMSISQTNRVVTKEQRESISKKLTGHKQKKEQVEKRIDSMSNCKKLNSIIKYDKNRLPIRRYKAINTINICLF